MPVALGTPRQHGGPPPPRPPRRAIASALFRPIGISCGIALLEREAAIRGLGRIGGPRICHGPSYNHPPVAIDRVLTHDDVVSLEQPDVLAGGE